MLLQMIGRVGRTAGVPGLAVVYYNKNDLVLLMDYAKIARSQSAVDAALKYANAVKTMLEDNTVCRHVSLMRGFKQVLPDKLERCGTMCDVCCRS